MEMAIETLFSWERWLLNSFIPPVMSVYATPNLEKGTIKFTWSSEVPVTKVYNLLNFRWVRLFVFWSAQEPKNGGYSQKIVYREKQFNGFYELRISWEFFIAYLQRTKALFISSILVNKLSPNQNSTVSL